LKFLNSFKNSGVKEFGIGFGTFQKMLYGMFMQNFSSLACTQTDLDTFLNIFEEKFRIFQENSLANSQNFKPDYAIFCLT
jgi:hypothetical protein